MTPRRLAWVIIGAGAALRIWGFVSADSLWLDELYLARGLRTLDFAQLSGPLPHLQSAPWGWLVLQKAWTTVAGDGEGALRSLSLVNSLLALPLTLIVGRRALGERTALFPLAVVALSPFVVWQALQFKPYSTDLLVGLAIVAWASRALDQRSRATFASLAGIGALSVLVSLPATFVLAGCAGVLLLRAWRSPPAMASIRGPVIVVVAIWALAAGANYVILLRPVSDIDMLYAYWAAGLFAWPLDGLGDLVWPLRVVARALANPVGFHGIGWVTLPFLGWGIVALHRIRRAELDLLVAPALVTFAAAFAGVYPFERRLILFLVPALAALVAIGIDGLASRLRSSASRGPGLVFAAPIAAPLLVTMLWLPSGGVPMAADVRELFTTLDRVARPGEVVILDFDAEFAFHYYGEDLSLRPVTVENRSSGIARIEGVSAALSGVARGPTWVVMTQVRSSAPPPLREALANDLAGTRLHIPSVWSLYAQTLRGWDDVSSFEDHLDAGWRVSRRIAFDGALLVRVEPIEPR